MPNRSKRCKNKYLKSSEVQTLPCLLLSYRTTQFIILQRNYLNPCQLVPIYYSARINIARASNLLFIKLRIKSDHTPIMHNKLITQVITYDMGASPPFQFTGSTYWQVVRGQCSGTSEYQGSRVQINSIPKVAFLGLK